MISRRIPHAPGNDRYRRLALYIADAGRQGEKALMSWCAGGWSEDDYQLAIDEVELVQATNVRTAREKTYHLLVSFRPEDEDKLTPEIFREIEAAFAQALGLAEHQRHAGVHRNTANLHLHAAYNLIHPERRTRHSPFLDFLVRDKLCRELERKYGLSPDRGRQERDGREATGRTPDGAQAFEIHSGQESFLNFARRRMESLRPALAEVKTWPEVHALLSGRGLKLQPKGAGLIVQDLAGRQAVKASDLGREFSKGRLEKRFGPFVAPAAGVQTSLEKYDAAPLQAEPDRARLYDDYKEAMEKRRIALLAVKSMEDRLSGIIRGQWDKKWAEVKRLPMLRKHRRETLERLKKAKRTDFEGLRKQLNLKREGIRKEYPFSNWNQFLRYRASQGQEEALAVLRSRKQKVWAEPVYGREKNGLVSVKRMGEILGAAAAKTGYRVDEKGTVIFTLPGGGRIMDSGEAIHFRPGDEATKAAAGKLAQARWGSQASAQGSVFKKADAWVMELRREPKPGLGR